MDVSHIFLQCVLAAITLVGGGAGDGVAGDGVARAGSGCGTSPLLSGCHYPEALRAVRSLRVGSELALFPLSVCFFPFPSLQPLPQSGGMLKQVGPVQALRTCPLLKEI